MGTSREHRKTRFTIGRLARAAGVGVATVRYYQKRNLLRVPSVSGMGSYRTYGEQDLGQLLLIRRAQELGFTLSEIMEFSSHLDARSCDAIRELGSRKLQAIRAELRVLERARRNLSAIMDGCRDGCVGACPLLNRLRNVEGC